LLVEYGYTPTRETLNVGAWQVSNETPVNLIIAEQIESRFLC
jgi:hypothetical protein